MFWVHFAKGRDLVAKDRVLIVEKQCVEGDPCETERAQGGWVQKCQIWIWHLKLLSPRGALDGGAAARARGHAGASGAWV